jgi:hypothetical protein
MFPRLQEKLAAILDLNAPIPFPLAEFGLTEYQFQRSNQHLTHSGTTAAFALFEYLSFHLFDGRYRWCFHPVALYRDRHEGPMLVI